MWFLPFMKGVFEYMLITFDLKKQFIDQIGFKTELKRKSGLFSPEY